MGKHNPHNKTDAYCYQIEDNLRVLRTLSLLKDKEEYNRHIDLIINRLNELKYGDTNSRKARL